MDKKQTKPINAKSRSESNVVADPRFQSVHSDPRFSRLKRGNFKVKVDERFKSLKEDKDFKTTASVDRYGRPLNQDKATKEIDRLYELENEGSSSSSESSEITDNEEVASASSKSTKSEELTDEESEDEEVYDPARGEGIISTSESSDESDAESETEAQPEISELAGIEPEENIPRGSETNRLAVVNMDWDNLQAVDLFVALSSFCPPGGKLLKVSIYPSEFGKSRMAAEHVQGPPRDIFTPADNQPSSAELHEAQKFGFDNNESDQDEEDALIEEDLGNEFDMVKLRQYQLERLRYYYAVVECDSVRTAKVIYESCDGAEYETSANIYDLRFIPDDVTFDDDESREVCTKAPEKYEPRDFVTDALQHSKVKLSWDAEDPHRKDLIKKAFTSQDIEDLDFSAYIASSESEDEDVDVIRSRYQKLLSGDADDFQANSNPFEDDDKLEGANGEMEVTFTSGFDVDNNANSSEKDETTIEKYKRKAAERKQRRKELRQLKKTKDDEGEGSDVDLGFDDPFFKDKDASRNNKKNKKGKHTQIEDPTAASKEELENLVREDENDSEQLDHFDMKSILKAEKFKKNRKLKKKASNLEGLQEGFEADVSDPRFAALYTNHNFALDPTNPHFKRTKTVEKIMDESRKRRSNQLEQTQDGKPELKIKKRKAEKGDQRQELDRIVKSIKRSGK
ncbi:Pre-rRNA-processing protein esf1 [Schizosaccharomyces pombe]